METSLWVLISTVLVIDILSMMSPGVDFAIVTNSALTRGRRHGFITASGIALGVAVHVTYCLIGVGALVSQSIVAMQVLKVLGAVYLVGMGCRAIWTASPARVVVSPEMTDVTAGESFRRGFVANLLNAEATLFFVMLFSVVITPEMSLGVRALLGGLIVLIELSYWALLVTVFTFAPVQRVFYRGKLWIERLFGGVMVVAGGQVLGSLRKGA